jgi:pimeloyl-ACP methyl ester carboxylesterase
MIGKCLKLLLAGQVVAAVAASPAKAVPTLTVEPVDALMDAPFSVRLSGLRPGTQVELRTKRTADEGPPWVGIGTFIADAKGVVNPATMPSSAGTYTGLSPHGLLCSPLPVAPEALASYLAGFAPNPRQPTTFDDKLGMNTIELTAAIDGRVVASTTIQRTYAKGTAGEDVTEAEGWKGVYFRPAAGAKVAAPVLLLAGSGGGIFRFTAARLASHGHPTLAAAMFRYPGLPDSLVRYPIENIRNAALWLAKRARTEKVAVIGISRGSEAAALAAANFPEAFSAVVLVVPSHLSDVGALGPAAKPGDSAWTIDGKPTPVADLGFLPTDPDVVEQAKTWPGYNASAMALDKWQSPELARRFGIPFERIAAPILVQAAGADAVWPSWISATLIQKRLAAHGRSQQVEVHTYPNAGHNMVQIGLGSPLTLSSYHPPLKGFMAFGGTPNGTCEASFNSARDALRFLSRIPS